MPSGRKVSGSGTGKGKRRGLDTQGAVKWTVEHLDAPGAKPPNKLCKALLELAIEDKSAFLDRWVRPMAVKQAQERMKGKVADDGRRLDEQLADIQRRMRAALGA